MYLIEDINGLQYKVDSLAKFCKEKEITLRLIRYTNPKWKNVEGKRYQEYHKGFKIISEDIEADIVENEEIKKDELEKLKNNSVLVIGDLHAPFEHKDYLKFCKDMYKKYNCNKVVFIGDIIDNHYSSYHESDPDGFGGGVELELAKKSIAEFHREFPNSLVCIGNHDCFDQETEILTINGFKKGLDLNENDIVATMNLNKHNLEYQKPTSIIKRKHIGEIFKYKNSNLLDLVITPNHRILNMEIGNEINSRNYKFDKAYKIIKGSKYLPVTLENINDDLEALSDDEIMLLGWLGSDGSICNDKLFIYQSKIDMCEKIERILNSLSIDYIKKSRKRNITHICGKELKNEPMKSFEYHFKYKKISDIYKNKYILPRELDLLSNRQFFIYINSFIDGDGSRKYDEDGNARDGCCIYGVRDMLEQLQILCMKNSISSFITEYRSGDYRLNITFNKKNVALNLHKMLSVEHYDGYVWCATVPNSTLVVRRNGKIQIQGNCIPNRKAFSNGLSNQWIKSIGEVVNTPTWTYSDGFMIDGVKYTHGLGRKARQRSQQDMVSVVQGHYHSESYIENYVGEDGGRRFAMQIGSGINIKEYAFAYGRHFAKPHVNVGIVINGKLPIIEFMDI